MNRSGLIRAGLAPLLLAPFASCTHILPGEPDMGPHETVRISTKTGRTDPYAAGTEVQTALAAWRKSHGQFPPSLLEIPPSAIRGYTVSAACEDGLTGAQTLIYYRRTGSGGCTVQVRDYIQGGGLLSLQEMRCRSGEWTARATVHYNVAPR